jgi:hypothetical protein
LLMVALVAERGDTRGRGRALGELRAERWCRARGQRRRGARA